MKLFKKLMIMAMAAFAFTACDDVPAPYTVPGEDNGTGLPEGTYIDESFANGFGTFSTVETVGNYPWVIDYSTAKATSYDSDSQTNNPAESWLISAPVDFTDETEAYVKFEYIIRYAESGKVADNHQLLVSADYAGDPAKATWVNIDYSAVEGVDWTTFYTANANVPAEFMGKAAVTFALKYTATSKSATWEVKNFSVEHGNVEATTPDNNGEYINETFASDFGVFSTVETVGNYPWVIDYSTAKATSYDSDSQTNNPAESWLISAPVDFTDETEAYVKFEYIIRYAESGKVADNHQLLVSADYAGDPAKATWVNIDYSAVEGVDWITFYTANANVPAEFMGKTAVTFALKYTATSKSATWEVKNFVVAHGKPEESTPTETKEYTVTEALAAYTAGQQIPAAVTGYIVGTVDGKSIDGALFSGTATVNTNLLIADNADETDVNKCIPVQLPSGNVRSALNLVDNPANYKKQVKLTGSIEKYFGVGGLKSVTAYEFTGEGGNTENPETPEGVSSVADVIAAGASDAATVQGTIIATYSRGFIVNDGTGSILVYLGEDKGFQTGDVVTVSGATTLYGGLLQFGNTSTVEKTGTATVETPVATAWTGSDMDDYINAPSVKYVQYTGKLTISGYYYNVEVDGASTAIGSIAYPTDGLVDSALDGKNITVTGYAIGVSGGKYINTMAVSVVAADSSESGGDNGDDNNNGGEATGETTVFDFTSPTALNPSVTPSEEASTGVEFADVTFTNGNISIHTLQGSAGIGARIWTKTDGTYEFRAYNGSTITISTADGSNMSSIGFEGYKITSMSPDKGTFNAGTWSGNNNSVTFNVTGTLNIKQITVK